jgi:hypothetical protein
MFLTPLAVLDGDGFRKSEITGARKMGPSIAEVIYPQESGRVNPGNAPFPRTCRVGEKNGGDAALSF